MLLHFTLFFSVCDQALTGKDLEDLLQPVTCTESVPGLVWRLRSALRFQYSTFLFNFNRHRFQAFLIPVWAKFCIVSTIYYESSIESLKRTLWILFSFIFGNIKKQKTKVPTAFRFPNLKLILILFWLSQLPLVSSFIDMVIDCHHWLRLYGLVYQAWITMCQRWNEEFIWMTNDLVQRTREQPWEHNNHPIWFMTVVVWLKEISKITSNCIGLGLVCSNSAHY